MFFVPFYSALAKYHIIQKTRLTYVVQVLLHELMGLMRLGSRLEVLVVVLIWYGQ